MSLWFELLILVVLIALNGFFALSEIALVSAKKARLQILANAGGRHARGALLALELTEHSDRFLPAVQMGMTLVATLAGAFSGATIAARLGTVLDSISLLAPYGQTIGFTIVVVTVTYLSLIIGELVPKQLAFRYPEIISTHVAAPLAWLTRALRPAVFLLQKSTHFVFWLMRVKHHKNDSVTEDEVKAMVDEGAQTGVFVEAEKQMIKRVLRLSDKPIRAIMTARGDIDWLDINDQDDQTIRYIHETNHSIYPVCDGDLDKIIGIVRAKDLLDQQLSAIPFNLRKVMHDPLVYPETTSILQVLERLKQSSIHLGVVVDEYGTIEGVVTAMDILGAIVGDLPDYGEHEDAMAVQRSDGTWLMDGSLPIDEAKEILNVQSIPGDDDYHTLAGIVLAHINRIPRASDKFTIGDFTFEVMDMDGRRVDKILITKKNTEEDT